MNIEETYSAKGRVSIKVYNREGRVIQRIDQDNLIVNVGKQAMARLLGAADSNKRVTQIAFGTSGVPVSGGQTAITSSYVKALDGVTYSGTSAIFQYALEYNENNGMTIQEFGLLCDDNTLFSRITRNSLQKTADIRLTGTWTITF